VAEPENTRKDADLELPLPKSQGALAKVLPWLAMALAVLLLGAGGFFVGRSFGTRGHAPTAAGAEQGQEAHPAETKESATAHDAGESWYYDLDTVVVNLNEPGVTRYVRVGLTLEVSGLLKEDEGKPLLDQKRPLIKHWLTLFLSNQTLDEGRGEKNLVRIQTKISEVMNNGLFPGAAPRIKNVLFKEYAIQ
jgi:flagellar basal body-associated protein FliL